MKPQQLEKLADVIVDVIKKALAPVQAHCVSLEQRNAGLEQRIKQLESRPLQKWAGVHIAGTQYSEASLVTKAGSLWVATTTTTTTPGEAGGDWRVIVKRGHA